MFEYMVAGLAAVLASGNGTYEEAYEAFYAECNRDNVTYATLSVAGRLTAAYRDGQYL